MTNPELLTDLDLLERHWERTPFVARGLGDLTDVFSVRVVEELLAAGTLPGGSLRLFRDGKAIPEERYTRIRERNGRQRERLVEPDAVLRDLAHGATVVLEELETYFPGVRTLAAGFRDMTGFSTYCAGFLTPSSTPGLRAHYDLTSVLIRQTHGSKRWRVSEPVNRLPEREWSEHEAPTGEPVLDVVLRAGDCLYVPRGYFHAGEATEQGSVHLSVAIKPVTWRDLLARLISADPGEVLRESVPFGFHRGSADELVAGVRERVLGMLGHLEDDDGGIAAAKALSQPMRAAATRTWGGPPPAGSLADVLERTEGDEETTSGASREA